MTFFVSSGTFYTFAVGSSADASGQRAGSFSEDRPLGWDPVAAGNRAGDGMARFVSEEEASDPLTDVYPLVSTQYSPMLWPG